MKFFNYNHTLFYSHSRIVLFTITQCFICNHALFYLQSCIVLFTIMQSFIYIRANFYLQSWLRLNVVNKTSPYARTMNPTLHSFRVDKDFCYDCTVVQLHNENPERPPPPHCPICESLMTGILRLYCLLYRQESIREKHSVSSVRLVYHVGQMIFYVVVLSWVKLTLKLIIKWITTFES